VRKKDYCILNKQYAKEEYLRLVPKIREHMNEMPYVDSAGRVYKYGEFFPPELSLFAYNETTAQEYFPITKEMAIKSGFRWRESEENKYVATIETENLPDVIGDVDDSILKELIRCAHRGACNHRCTSAFRIIPEELALYRRMGLSLPRLCYNCRYRSIIQHRNPLKLWRRKCQCAGSASSNNIYKNTASHFHGESSCPNEFETSYSPDGKDIIYCEKCYQAEVV
jgi:hypothetical protein